MGRNRYEIRIQSSEHIAKFLTKLTAVQAKMNALTTTKEGVVFLTDRKGLKLVRKYRRRYRLKLSIRSIEEDKGLASIFRTYHFLLFVGIPFLSSFFLWSVTVESEMPEVNDRIEKKMKQASITPFRFLTMLPDETEIRRQLMEDESSLSWIYFNRSGTKLTVTPMLSPSLEEQHMTEEGPSDLIAKTGGVITSFELLTGERVARLYETVKKGDLLATGTLVQGDFEKVVGAKGAVFADYWMEYRFELPRKIEFKVQDEQELSFSFNWPEKGTYPFERKYWQMIKAHQVTKEKHASLEIEEGMETSVIIPLLKMKLLSEASPAAMIKEEKVLHVSFDDDKVKGTILFYMNDNIAIQRPIRKEAEAID